MNKETLGLENTTSTLSKEGILIYDTTNQIEYALLPGKNAIESSDSTAFAIEWLGLGIVIFFILAAAFLLVRK